MIFTCDHCRYLFKGSADDTVCPDCGKPAVRPSTAKEEKEFWKFQKEFHPEDFPK